SFSGEALGKINWCASLLSHADNDGINPASRHSALRSASGEVLRAPQSAEKQKLSFPRAPLDRPDRASDTASARWRFLGRNMPDPAEKALTGTLPELPT